MALRVIIPATFSDTNAITDSHPGSFLPIAINTDSGTLTAPPF